MQKLSSEEVAWGRKMGITRRQGKGTKERRPQDVHVREPVGCKECGHMHWVKRTYTKAEWERLMAAQVPPEAKVDMARPEGLVSPP